MIAYTFMEASYLNGNHAFSILVLNVLLLMAIFIISIRPGLETL